MYAIYASYKSTNSGSRLSSPSAASMMFHSLHVQVSNIVPLRLRLFALHTAVADYMKQKDKDKKTKIRSMSS